MALKLPLLSSPLPHWQQCVGPNSASKDIERYFVIDSVKAELHSMSPLFSSSITVVIYVFIYMVIYTQAGKCTGWSSECCHCVPSSLGFGAFCSWQCPLWAQEPLLWQECLARMWLFTEQDVLLHFPWWQHAHKLPTAAHRAAACFPAWKLDINLSKPATGAMCHLQGGC